MIPTPHRMKAHVVLGASQSGQSGPFGPYGADSAEDTDERAQEAAGAGGEEPRDYAADSPAAGTGVTGAALAGA
ncbi:hypothetical protein BKD26_36110 [Streptomyces sp. CB03238]|nr:hypothetical protein BKD26_36110 [Streptomyces sp. CB03238]